ncbi:hypothetical protein MTR_2g449730 [Medicago truncatula]|uniref:Chromo domain-containing protein n=1 Tax=Medicago truncatula TaxID=3880 RepID=A0A072V886_MEDTR|nr:hypothetical protein MTR_2g449730 [Medicago truncatula]
MNKITTRALHRTFLCWYKSGESALIRMEVVQETIEKVKMIHENMIASQSMQKLSWKYVYDMSHMIQVDDIEVRDNLTVKTWPVRIEDREVKRIRGKEIFLVKVIWVGPTGESATWESESKMRVSYTELFSSVFCDFGEDDKLSWTMVLMIFNEMNELNMMN